MILQCKRGLIKKSHCSGTTTLSIVNGKIVGHRSSSSNDDDDDEEEEELVVQKRMEKISAPKVKYELAKGEKFPDVSAESHTLNPAELLAPLSPDNNNSSSAAQDCDKENHEDSMVKVWTKPFDHLLL